MRTTLYQNAEQNWAADEAAATVTGYRENVLDEGEALALECLQRDVSPATLQRLFPDEPETQQEYVRLVTEALPEQATYLK